MSQPEKRFYWIKLKSDFFDLPTIDFLQDQKNGCEYIVLYQKLCLLSANTNGSLVRRVGELVIPYDARKISEVTRFKYDMVIVALEIFRKIGLVVENEGIMNLPGIQDMVGSATVGAEKKRLQRERKRENERTDVLQLSQKAGIKMGTEKKTKEGQKRDNVPPNVPLDVPTDAHQDVQDSEGTFDGKSVQESIEYRVYKTGGGGINTRTDADARAVLEEKSAEPADEDAENQEIAGVIATFENIIHPIVNDAQRDRIYQLGDDYGWDWLNHAILEAGVSEGKTIRYIEVILARWRSGGHSRPWEEDRRRGTSKNGNGADKPVRSPGRAPTESAAADGIDWEQFDNTAADISGVSQEVGASGELAGG